MFQLKCYICKNEEIDPVYFLKNRIIYRCLNDELYFSVDKKDEKIEYDENYFESSPYGMWKTLNDSYFQTKLDKIVKLTSETNPNILDVGCGWGNFLQVLKNNQLYYLGIDYSAEAIEICRKKRLNCQQIDLVNTNKFNNQQYSAITFFQVLEHLKNPILYLKAAMKLLKKNGVIILTTPNNQSPLRYLAGSRWSVYNTPSHYFFYSKKSLESLLKLAGFNNFIIKIDRLRFFTTGYVWQRLFNKKLLSQINNIPIPTDPWGDLEVIIYKNS